MQLVFGPVKERLIMTRHVAGHAAAGILIRLSMKSKDELLRRRDLGVVARSGLDGFNVSFPRTVTAFATCAVLGILWRRRRVNCLYEGVSVDRMTTDTRVSTHVIARLSKQGKFPDNGRGCVDLRLFLP
jgi:hypothetical protein